jgi:hypothetical protein
VVDVVDLALVAAELQDVLDAVDDVLREEGLLRLGDVEAELPVEPESADAAEAVAGRVEELLVEQGAGLLDLGRVPGPQTAVDLEEGLLVVARGVLEQGVEDQG